MVNNNITEQEIREVVLFIESDPEPEHIKHVKDVFDTNPQLLEKLIDEELKANYIRQVYSQDYLRGRVAKYLREKERAEQEKSNLDTKIEDLEKKIVNILSAWYKDEEEKESNWNYWSPEELKELISESKVNLNKVVIKIIEKWEQDAKSHSQAVDTAEVWKDRQLADLRNEVEEERSKSERSNKIITDQKTKIKELEQRLEEEIKKREKANQTVLNEKLEKKELKNQLNFVQNKLHLATKSLPSLPKNKINFKRLGTKIKTSFHKLIKREKVQEQTLIAQVEVRNN